MTFVFYDTETTGTSTSFDQILQFAAIRTDTELNEIARFEIRSRLLPHIVPGPGAMRITGVTVAQLIDRSLPSHYEMVRRIRETLISWSPAIFLGYNTLDFDEHLFRQALYKTLHPPYLTNTDGNARSDVMRMVQAASLFAPNALALPMGENGQTVFKLDRVAPINGFGHERAHDAMADVEATIHLCRLLSQRAPDVWSAFMRFSRKAAVADFVSSETIFCLADFFFGRPYSWLVTPIGNSSNNSNEFYVYNLAVNPASLMSLSAAQLVTRLGRSPKPIRRLRGNAAPILFPAEEAPALTEGCEYGMDELNRRADLLQADPEFRARLIASFEATRDEREPSIYVEERIYDGFFPDADQRLMERFHAAAWEERIGIVERFVDRRLQQIGRQLVHAECPDVLDEATCRAYDEQVARRLLGTDGDVPWLTLPKALQEVEDLLLATDQDNAVHLTEHRNYLHERLTSATRLLR